MKEGDVPGIDELKAMYEALKEASQCIVCQEQLRPETSICAKGHVICKCCNQSMSFVGEKTCPTCGEEFSSTPQSSFVHQVLAAIPHKCRYENCSYLVKCGDDHEQHCFFMPTVCKLCSWKGTCKELVIHMQKEHVHNIYYKCKKFFIKEIKEWPVINLIYDWKNVGFWEVVDFHPKESTYSFSFFPLWKESSEDFYYVRIEFHGSCYNSRFEFKFYLNHDVNRQSINNNNRIYIHKSIVENCGYCCGHCSIGYTDKQIDFSNE